MTRSLPCHSGINTARAKIILFMISGAFSSAGGRDPRAALDLCRAAIAFSPMMSFLVVIMALLGGTHRLWGPLVGVIPFTLMWDFVSVRFPATRRSCSGLRFWLSFICLPDGFVGLIEDARRHWGRGQADTAAGAKVTLRRVPRVTNALRRPRRGQRRHLTCMRTRCSA